MKKYIIIWLIITNNIFLIAQGCHEENLLFHIKIKNHKITTIDALFLEYQIINYGEKTSIVSPWDIEYRPTLELKTPNSDWVEIENSNQYQGHTQKNRIVLNKGDSLINKTVWANLPFLLADDKRVFSFKENQKYYIRSKYKPCNREFIFSELDSFIVVSPAKEIEVFEWLHQNAPHPTFLLETLHGHNCSFYGFGFYSYRVSEHFKFDPFEAVNKFLDLYPSSSYSLYAKLYLAYYYYEGLYFKPAPWIGEGLKERVFSEPDFEKVE